MSITDEVLKINKVLNYFKQGVVDGSVKFSGNLEEYRDSGKFQQLINRLYKAKWVVLSSNHSQVRFE